MTICFLKLLPLRIFFLKADCHAALHYTSNYNFRGMVLTSKKGTLWQDFGKCLYVTTDKDLKFDTMIQGYFKNIK